MSTDVSQFIADLDGGVFEQKLAHMLSQVAAATIDHGRQGSISIELKMKQIGSSHQVQVDHVLKYKRPTKRGTQSEDEATSTPMHVGTGGKLSFFPEKQGQMFDKAGALSRTPYPQEQE